jgi:hypothetical protein
VSSVALEVIVDPVELRFVVGRVLVGGDANYAGALTHTRTGQD